MDDEQEQRRMECEEAVLRRRADDSLGGEGLGVVTLEVRKSEDERGGRG
jgi:hypothetical protein